MRLWPCVLLLLPALASAADPPQAEISNGRLRARLYVPDAEHGYYRATRFDWSGVIASLDSEKHSYFGQWFERYDPKLHDSITGPVESFQAIGYETAPVGGRFLRIGVGWLAKPQEPRVNDFRTYEILDSGKWSVRRGPDWVEFTQELAGTYVYRKTVRLVDNRLILEHSLKNTGTAALDTQVFNHDFYMLDGQPTGPDIVVRFPFEPRPESEWHGPQGEVRGKEIVYREELAKGVSVSGWLKGFSDRVADHDFVIENRKTGARVRQVGDRPIARVNFWSIRTTVCPEAYIRVHAEPGKEESWKITYTFE
jgi:hypothetical protein